MIANRPTDHARPGRADRSNRACLPARAGQHALVTGRSSDSQAWRTACLLGSVRPRANGPNGSMQPSFVSTGPRGQSPKGLDEDAWTQRRGRPGITPEFPVCRRKAAAILRPPETLVECRDQNDLVKNAIARPPFPQSLTAAVDGWKAVAIAPVIDGSTLRIVRRATTHPSREEEPSVLARNAP